MSLSESAPGKAAREKAAHLLGRRAMSRGELERKLRSKGFEDKAAEDAADWLEGLGVLDDGDYAGMIARHYTAKGYGVLRVKEELRKRLVPRELWDEAIESLGGTDSELDRLLAARLGGVRPDRASLKKTSDYLRRRGYEWDEIRAAFERMEFSD